LMNIHHIAIFIVQPTTIITIIITIIMIIKVTITAIIKTEPIDAWSE
jgi:hypothetical protein